jgi:hypothetical protein
MTLIFKKFICVIVFCLCICWQGFSQIGGRHAYEFLNLVSSPAIAALGGKNITGSGNDLSQVYHNPSLLNADMDQSLSLNYVNYFADIKYGYASYAYQSKSKRTWAYGMQYINYGTFTAAESNGVITGTFKAAEYAPTVSCSQPIDSFLFIGASVHPILSILENYQSVGISTDLGITWIRPHKGQTFAFVVRNLGSQIITYDSYETLPFELQLGFSQKLEHAPFRFSVTAHHIETWDMSVPDYEYEQEKANSTNVTPDTELSGIEKFGDNLMRHIVIGVELTPFKSLCVRFGYNYQRRQELKIDSHPGFTGFSWGASLSLARFQIGYGRARYNLAGVTNHFSVSTNLKYFYKKKNDTNI